MVPPNRTSDHVDIPAGPRAVADTSRHRLTLTTAQVPRGEVLVTVDGEIDLYSEAAFSSGLHRAMGHPSCRTLIVDLCRVRFDVHPPEPLRR